MATRLEARLLHCGAYVLLGGLFLAVPWDAALAQRRVIQKWVNRVEAPAGATGPTVPVIAADSEGNVIVAGNTDVTENTTTDTLQIIKYNSVGKQLWATTLQTPGYSPVAQAATMDSSGDFFVTMAGTALVNQGPYQEFVTAEVSPSGAIKWSTPFELRKIINVIPLSNATVAGIVLDPQGNSYISGWVQEDTQAAIYTIKYSATGAQLWEEEFAGAGQFGGFNEVAGIALDAQSNVFITGRVQPCDELCTMSGTGAGEPGQHTGLTAKYNTNGTLLWTTYTGDTGGTTASVYANGAVAVDASGNSYVTGWSNTDGSICPDAPETNYGETAQNSSGTIFEIVEKNFCETGYVVKYNPGGTALWTEQGATWGSNAIKLDREGNIFTGGSYFTSNSSHYSVTKLNSSGTLQWNRTYQHTTTGNDQGLAMAVNFDSDVYITGQISSTNNATGFDCATLKLNSEGVLQWVAAYNGPGNGNDIGMGIAFSGSFLYIVAESAGANKAPGFATIEYVQDAAVVSPTVVTFAAQKIGTTSAAQTATLTNTYAGEDLTLMGIDVHGPFEATNNCPKNIVPNGTCTLTIKFVPTAAGTATGSIDIYDQWAGSPAIIQLSGTGTN
jgi:hypothetical protein